VGFRWDPTTVEAVDQKIPGAIAAVADGKAFCGRDQAAAGQAPLDSGCRSIGGDAILKSVRGDQDVHAVNDEGANIRE
jgi:hypothetical protein